MKILVGLASVAVIAFVGYFFWGEWQTRQTELAIRSQLALSERARASLFNQANLEPGDEAGLADYCQRISDLTVWRLKDNEVALATAHNCRVLGYVQ